MKKAIRNIAIFLIIALPIYALSGPLNKMDERVKTLKKIKLIEFLNLDEAKAEKLLIKYNSMQKVIESKIEEIEKTGIEIENALESKKSDEELRKINDKFVKQADELHKINQSNTEQIRTMLDEKEFAKFLVFELKFRSELKESLKNLRDKRKRFKD